MSAKNGKPCKQCGANEWYKNGRCAPCTRQRVRQWERANPDKAKEGCNRWRKANQDRVNKKNRQWNQDHPDKAKESRRRWRQANHEKDRENSLRWNQANPEANAAYYHRRRTRKTAAGGSFTAAEFKALVSHYDNKCLCCGRDDVKLTADHVIPVSKGGSSNIENIQPLCKPCNSHKSEKTIDYRPDSGLGRWIQRKLFG